MRTYPPIALHRATACSTFASVVAIRAMNPDYLLELLGDLLVGLAASSIWAAAAYAVYNREQRRNRALAAFMLTPIMDRLAGVLSELRAELPVIEALPRTQTRIESYETRIIRITSQLDIGWVLSHLPRETNGVSWTEDITFVIGNAHEVADELRTIRESIAAKEPKSERDGNYESVLLESAELCEAIAAQIKAAQTLAPHMLLTQ